MTPLEIRAAALEAAARVAAGNAVNSTRNATDVVYMAQRFVDFLEGR
jgi:hypothetical protein